MNAYERLELIATSIDSDAKALHILLDDVQMDRDPYRVYAANDVI